MSRQTSDSASRSEVQGRAAAAVIEADQPAAAATEETTAARKGEQKARIKGLDHDTLINLYYQMLLVRRFEEKSAESYSMGKIVGFCHLYIGQEAVAIGAISAIRRDDYVLTSYREHGHALAKGMSPESVMAELYGKATGCSKGKGGSMHMFDKNVNFLGGHAIVGGQIPLATGVAFASKYQGTDQVTLCFFGEAAVNQGAFHESLNMAQLWKLPCIYICENNQYGMGTSVARASATTDLYKRGMSFDIPGERVDGMDVRAVKASADKAVEWCRTRNGPIILEMLTYRYRGHSMSDPAKYRSKEEVDKMRTGHDPIDQVRSRMLKKGFANEDALKKIDAEVRAIVNEAAEFATNDAEPDPAELYADVYK